MHLTLFARARRAAACTSAYNGGMTKPSHLALFGGTPVLKNQLPEVHNAGREEAVAAVRVIKEGPLSGFLGTASSRFLGGKYVRLFEKEFSKKFKVRHAVSYNSATSALHAAIVALGIGPGDEVIVPPYTMSATVTAVLQNGATPIFADIEDKMFCIDPKSVESRITKNTKAIMAVNLFGQAADFGALLPLSKKYGLKIIEDNAQSPGALCRGKYAGTVGDVGVFSLNVHKAIQTGEGGVLVTNDDAYALRAQLCRNHGESVVDDLPGYDAGPIFGSNYRMTELEAAVAYEQLEKLERFNAHKVGLCEYLTAQLSGIPGITTPHIPEGNTHVYFNHALLIDESKLGLS